MPRAERRTAPQDLQLEVSRVLQAPPAIVWRAWTDPRQIERWWHPATFRRPTCERLDLRVGGGFRIVMPARDGAVYTAWGTYREIVSERKLAYDDRCDKDGETFHAATLVVTFTPEGTAATRLTIETTIELAAYAGTDLTPPVITEAWTRGWEQNLDGLATLLSEPAAPGRPSGVTQQETEIVFSRLLDAPRELVWRAWTDPRQLARWWGPLGFTSPVVQIEPQAGGRWHIDMRAPDGHVYPCRGRYLEVVPPERLVISDEIEPGETAFGDDPPPNSLHVVTFEAVGNKTRLTVTLRLAMPADRQKMAASGAVEGYLSTLDRLADFLSNPPKQ